MKAIACLAAALLVACGGNPPAPPAPLPTVLRGDPLRNDTRIGTYVSVPRGFSTSSYWIEGPDGLVLIDTQFLLSAAEDAVTQAEQLTGKKVVLAIVLHANPDKFNGTEVLQRRGVRVVTSEEVLGLIPAVHVKRTKWFYQRYKPDYPRETPKPESFGSATTTLDAGGIQVKVHVLGPGCSGAHVAVEFDGHLFVGDLVANRNHAWMELGLLDPWKARLEELLALKPTAVHPGRGASGGSELLTAQIAYLDRVRELAMAQKPTGTPDEAKIAAVEKALLAEYPDYGQPYFLKLGLPAVWSTLAAPTPAAPAEIQQAPTPEKAATP